MTYDNQTHIRRCCVGFAPGLRLAFAGVDPTYLALAKNSFSLGPCSGLCLVIPAQPAS